MQYQTIYPKPKQTIDLLPKSIPAVAEAIKAGKEVRFCNTVPRADCTVLFDGGNIPGNTYLSQKEVEWYQKRGQGRIRYKENSYRYAYYKTEAN